METIEVRADEPVKLYQACWSEWGHGEGCPGWGLCNFHDCWAWQDDYPCCGSIGGIISDDGNGGFILTIESDPSFADQNDAINLKKSLIVDDNLISNNGSDKWSSIAILAGTYLFDETIGDNGGYVISSLITTN